MFWDRFKHRWSPTGFRNIELEEEKPTLIILVQISASMKGNGEGSKRAPALIG